MASDEGKLLLPQATTLKRKRNRNIKFSEDKRSQRLNFKKRKSTLKNKAEELAALCDVMVCMVCFGPDGEVVTWPEKGTEVGELINKCKEIGENAKERRARSSRSTSSSSLSGFLESKREKVAEKLCRVEWESRRRELALVRRSKGDKGDSFPSWDEKLNQFSEEGLQGLCNSLEHKLQNLREKIWMIQTKETQNRNINQFNMVGTDQCYYQPPSQAQALGWLNGECFGDQPVLAGPVASEAWPEQYYRNMWSKNNNSGNNHNWLSTNAMFSDQQVLAACINNEVWPEEECCADAESSSINKNRNCLPQSMIFDYQPVSAAPLDGAVFSAQQVLAACINNEVWPEEECCADAESSSINKNRNCLPQSMIFDYQPVSVAPLNGVNGEDSGSKNYNTNIINNNDHEDNLLADPDWFWGTSQLCFYD